MIGTGGTFAASGDKKIKGLLDSDEEAKKDEDSDEFVPAKIAPKANPVSKPAEKKKMFESDEESDDDFKPK